MQFTLGPPTAAPAVPTYAPPPPPPVDPEFEAVGRTAIEERDPDAPLPGRRTSKLQVFILAGIAAVLMASTLLVIIFKVMRRGDDPGQASAVEKDTGRNIAINGLPSGWAHDDTTRVKVGSAYAFKRENPEAYAVFGSTEYEANRSPRSSEMRRDLMAPLGKLFDITKIEKYPPLETSWLGETIAPLHGLKFRAPGDGLTWQGEAYTVSNKGLAYFWASWCKESDFDGLKDEFSQFRARFKLLELRKDWKEIIPNAMDYKGAVVPYTFTDAEDIWKEASVEEFKKDFPELDRRLRINDTPRGDRKAIADEAELRVFILDGDGDPTQRAREYVQNYWVTRLKEQSDTLPAPTFTELTDTPQGDPISDTVKAVAPVVRLQSEVREGKKVIAATESRLIVCSGARVGDKIVVLHCWCELSKRGVFETRFIQIASSLR